MRKPEIGLCDRDIRYIEGLSERLEADQKVHIRTMLFSEMSEVDSYLKKNNLMIIFSNDTEDCERDERGEYFYRGIRCIPLTEYREEEGIFKYQKVARVCKEIMKRLRPEVSDVRKVNACYGVYSPLGRCGKTSLAKALAGSDEIRGGLYIGMEDFSGDDPEQQNPDFLYKVKQRLPEVTEEIVSRALVLDGTGLFDISGIFLDSRDVRRADVEWLRDQIFASGRYTTVVFDIGSAAIEDFEVLEAFDRIFLPILDDEISGKKLARFEDVLRSMGLSSVTGNITPAKVPEADFSSPEMMRCVWKLLHREEAF